MKATSRMDTVGEETNIETSTHRLGKVVSDVGCSADISALIQARGDGACKIIWKDAKCKGSFDLYLSQAALQGAQLSLALFNALQALVKIYLGHYICAAYNCLNAVTNIIKAGTIKHGKVFYCRSWAYVGSEEQ